MDTRSNKTIRGAVKILLKIIGIGIFIFLIVRVRPESLFSILNNIPFLHFIGIILLIINFYLLVAYRLKRMTFTKLNYVKVLDIWLKSGLLSFIAGIRGAAVGAKVGLLKLKGDGISNSLAGVSTELFYDAVFSLTVVTAFLLIDYKLFKQGLLRIVDPKLVAMISIVAFLALLISIYYKRDAFFGNYIHIVATSLKKGNLVINTALTLFIWLGNALIMLLYFRALGYRIGLWISMAAVCTGSIVGLLSFIPSGIGVYEFISSYILSLSGISLDNALSVTILMRFISIIVAASILVFINIFFAKGLKDAANVV